MESDNVHIRRGAAHALALFNGSAAKGGAANFTRFMHDKDADVRKSIVAALAWYVRDSEAVRMAFLEGLEKDDDLAFEVVIGLSRGASSQELTELMGHGSPMFRSQIVRAIGLKGRGATQALPLLERLLDDPAVALDAAVALFRIAPEREITRRKAEDFFSRQQLGIPYPGYYDDLRLAVRKHHHHHGAYWTPREAGSAVGRIFENVEFVGKTRQEVVDILGDPAHYPNTPDNVLVYSYSGKTFSGSGGYRLIMKDECVVEVVRWAGG